MGFMPKDVGIKKVYLNAVSIRDDYNKLFEYYQGLGFEKEGEEKHSDPLHTQDYLGDPEVILKSVCSQFI